MKPLKSVLKNRDNICLSVKLTKRFLEKIDGEIPDTHECIEWREGRDDKGYGKIGTTVDMKTTTMRIHRLSYMAFVGPIPNGMLVCHTCDNPPCYNPKHLMIGTHHDNHEDAWKRGRTTRGHKWFIDRDGNKKTVRAYEIECRAARQ